MTLAPEIPKRPHGKGPRQDKRQSAYTFSVDSAAEATMFRRPGNEVGFHFMPVIHGELLGFLGLSCG